MNKDSDRAKNAESIDEWLKMMFPDASADSEFDSDKVSPESIASKWAERAIDMLPNKPIKPTR